MSIRLKTFIFSFGLVCFIGISNTARSQSFSNQHWYFGNSSVAVEFERPNDSPVLIRGYKNPPFHQSGEGNATANNPETGDLLFYTDGFDVFDGSFVKMAGATTTNLQGDVNKNQGVAISGVPGNNKGYFIYTNTFVNGIQVSEVDMTANGNSVLLQPPLGQVLTINQPIANSTANPSDAMLVLANAFNDGYWLITLDQGTNNYKVLTINSSNPASWVETIYAGEGAIMDAAHFTFNADSSKIAVAPKSNNVNIQLLDIDLLTGDLFFDKEIPNSGNALNATEAIYDVAFSNDGSKLYYSIYGDQVGTAGNLMQFDLLDTTIVLAPQSVIPATIFGSYGLQKGPNGDLYHLYQETNGGSFLIGSLTDIDSVASLTTYTTAIENSENFSAYQFPAFLPNRNPQLTVSFTSAGNCANSITSFFPTITPAPTAVRWDFGDGSTSNELAPFYTYTGAGTMNVVLTAVLNGQMQTASVPIDITDFQVQLTLPQDTVACQCELPKYGPTCTPFSVTVQAQNDPGNLTYLWSNGDTGTTLSPDSAGYYYVVASDGICSTYAGVQVQEYDVAIPGITADTRANVWYFGDQAGIDFNPPGTTAIADGAMDAMEGCTAVSDRNGQIIFYTDGDILFDQTHTQIDTGLGGTPNVSGASAQSVISVSVPGDETLFYIFTTQSNSDLPVTTYNFSYSLFDLKGNNGLGSVIEKNVPLFAKSTERIAATANWVIMHEYGNNNFRAYPISANGVGNAVVSSTGEDYSIISADNGKGYMKLGGSNLGLAVVEDNGSGPTNYLDVYDFDGVTGEVSNLKRANLSTAGANGLAYGIEFAGGKIFVSIRNGASSGIMEYWLDFNDSLNWLSPMISTGVDVGAIQTGPDGQIYVAENGNGTLGLLLADSDTTAQSNSTYVPGGFSLAGGTFSNLGLPNFIQQSGTAGSPIGITVSSPACIGQQIFIAANVSSSIDELEWQITDPLGAIVFTSTNLMDTLTLNTPGDHLVALRIRNRCINPVGTFSDIITISPPPQTSDLPVVTFLCGPDVTLPIYTIDPANIADLDFAWSTGETTSSITVSAEGNYDVIITDRTSGCTETASTFVGPPLPIDVGPDQIICENDPLNLDSQVNADTYVWTINGTPQAGTRFLDFGALGLGGGAHTVQVDATIDLGGSIGPCTVTDQVIITINPAPIFAGEQTVPTTCGASVGQIAVDITTTGSFDYTIANESGTLTGPSIANPILNIPAGVNVLTLTNTVTGCVQTSNVTVIDDGPFEITDAQTIDASCLRNDGQITFDVGTGAIGSFKATVRDINDPTLVYTQDYNPGGNGSFLFDSPTPAGLPPSDYTLEIQEDAGLNCTAIWVGFPASNPPIAVPLTISSPTDTDLQISRNPVLECSGPINLSDPSIVPVTNWTLLEWSDDNGTTYNDASTTPYPGIGDNQVLIRASSATTCDIEQSINVIVTPSPIFHIEADETNICSGFVILNAILDDDGYGGTPGAVINYRWSTGETSQSITVNQTGTNTFTATAFHTINQSCTNSIAEPVTINPAFTVELSSTLACDDGQPFTLTANVTGQQTNLLDYIWFLNTQDLGRIGSSIIVLDEGDYEVVVEETGTNCTQTDLLTVSRIPLTATNLSSAPVFCPADSILTLNAGPDFISYLWSDGSTNQILEVSTGGLYTLAATNDFGCVTNDQSNAIEDCIPKVSGPNAFRPGGVNSTYSLFTEYIDTFEIFIYNRWGELVYNSPDAAFTWDGVYNGELLPAGQYSWVIRYTSSFRDRGTMEAYGGVVLLR